VISQLQTRRNYGPDRERIKHDFMSKHRRSTPEAKVFYVMADFCRDSIQRRTEYGKEMFPLSDVYRKYCNKLIAKLNLKIPDHETSTLSRYFCYIIFTLSPLLTFYNNIFPTKPSEQLTRYIKNNNSTKYLPEYLSGFIQNNYLIQNMIELIKSWLAPIVFTITAIFFVCTYKSEPKNITTLKKHHSKALEDEINIKDLTAYLLTMCYKSQDRLANLKDRDLDAQVDKDVKQIINHAQIDPSNDANPHESILAMIKSTVQGKAAIVGIIPSTKDFDKIIGVEVEMPTSSKPTYQNKIKSGSQNAKNGCYIL
jgi:hypothetical protein